MKAFYVLSVFVLVVAVFGDSVAAREGNPHRNRNRNRDHEFQRGPKPKREPLHGECCPCKPATSKFEKACQQFYQDVVIHECNTPTETYESEGHIAYKRFHGDDSEIFIDDGPVESYPAVRRPESDEYNHSIREEGGSIEYNSLEPNAAVWSTESKIDEPTQEFAENHHNAVGQLPVVPTVKVIIPSHAPVGKLNHHNAAEQLQIVPTVTNDKQTKDSVKLSDPIGTVANFVAQPVPIAAQIKLSSDHKTDDIPAE